MPGQEEDVVGKRNSSSGSSSSSKSIANGNGRQLDTSSGGEEDQMSNSENISIRDYAYHESNPLHFGYLDPSRREDIDEDGFVSTIGNHTSSHMQLDTEPHHAEDSGSEIDEDKRQSIFLPDSYVVNQRAVALYDFVPENDNELGLRGGDTIFISYRHGQGWLVAENEERTKTGLVPEEFVSYISESEDEAEQSQHNDEKARPFYLTQFITQSLQHNTNELRRNDDDVGNDSNADSEWEDIDALEADIDQKLHIAKEQGQAN